MIIEYGEHCYGEYLRVGGQDFDVMDYADKADWMAVIFSNLDDGAKLKVLIYALGSLPGETFISEKFDQCDQCGNYNSSTVREIKE